MLICVLAIVSYAKQAWSINLQVDMTRTYKQNISFSVCITQYPTLPNQSGSLKMHISFQTVLIGRTQAWTIVLSMSVEIVNRVLHRCIIESHTHTQLCNNVHGCIIESHTQPCNNWVTCCCCVQRASLHEWTLLVHCRQWLFLCWYSPCITAPTRLLSSHIPSCQGSSHTLWYFSVTSLIMERAGHCLLTVQQAVYATWQVMWSARV